MATVTDEVEAHIADTVDGLGVGEQLPSERMIAGELGVSRATVRLVLTKLVAAGRIRAEHGRGYFVAKRRRVTRRG